MKQGTQSIRRSIALILLTVIAIGLKYNETVKRIGQEVRGG